MKVKGRSPHKAADRLLTRLLNLLYILGLRLELVPGFDCDVTSSRRARQAFGWTGQDVGHFLSALGAAVILSQARGLWAQAKGDGPRSEKGGIACVLLGHIFSILA